jgi:hypothetical protein
MPALHGNNIPTTGRREPDRDDESGNPSRCDGTIALRKRVLGLGTYHAYDTTIPLVEIDEKYPYEVVLEWLPASVRAAGRRNISVSCATSLTAAGSTCYENPGKRSGAYSAPVYGVHPYMLLNHNDTLDAVFTLAHEMGHSMHTLLSHAHQPFVYFGYTIFIAEVPSTLSEALFPRVHARAGQERARAHRPPAARDRRDRRHVLHAGDVCRLRAAGAPARGRRAAGHRGAPQRDLLQSVQGLSTATRSTTTSYRASTWAGSRISYSTPYYVYSTPPALRRARS